MFRKKRKNSLVKASSRKMLIKTKLSKTKSSINKSVSLISKLLRKSNSFKNYSYKSHGSLVKSRAKINSLYLAKSSTSIVSNTIKLSNDRFYLKSKPTFTLPKTSLKLSNTISKFTLCYISLFIKFRIITLNFKFNSKKFLLKKSLFSFLKPNESKRNIMNRRKKINFSRLYNVIKSSMLHSSLNTKVSNITFKKKSKASVFHPVNMSTLNKNDYFNKTSSELFLPRVKFKPGYQRI
jgi:hypothetical protein